MALLYDVIVSPQIIDDLLGRAGGPMHFRLFLMPTVVTFLAIGPGWWTCIHRPFLWLVLTAL